jgi:hypothetical protein
MTTGINDLKQWGLPSYWDQTYLSKYRLADGTTYDTLVAAIQTGLATQNAQLWTSPLIGGLVSTTQEMTVEYRVGVSNGFEVHTEYGVPDAKRAATTGHMLPLVPYDRRLGWTWDFLRKARRPQIDADIASALADLRDRAQKAVLERLFKSTYTAVGSSGRSMPLADGGTADSSYVPVARPDRGGTFAYTHNHIAVLNGITQANVDTAVKNLWEHGVDGPYELLASYADVASWVNTTTVTGFVKRADTLVRYGSTVDLANVGADDPEVIGAIETSVGPCRVRLNGRVPTKYWAVYKSYGINDQRNPLRVRYDTTANTGAIILPQAGFREFPLEGVGLFLEFGVGVGEDRCAAVICYNDAGGAWADPTIA